MCGIFGIIQHDSERPPAESRLEKTARLLHHRGPDSYGVYTDDNIGLVHTRLALLDLNPRSNQPFWDQQGRYCLTYNGEIYNFKELSEELETLGVELRTSSDTEVLLELIINFGIEDALSKLEGMFAFGFYDKEEKTLMLARDRFGIKPLFICDSERALLFASEIKAMEPWMTFEPDLLSISSYLFGYSGPSKGHTFFKNIQILSPGTVVKVRKGQSAQYKKYLSVNEFWDPGQASDLKRLKPQQVVDKVEELLFESVHKQLFADAPVGALCSGGVDSSLIMAMAAKQHNNLAIFHADVDGPLSEFDAAKKLARHLKLDLKTAKVSDHDFVEKVPEVIEHFGHPFVLVNCSIPFLMVSQVVRDNGVKAVLSGEGSDESFLGYRFLAPDILRWKRQPGLALKFLARTKRKIFNAGYHTRWPTGFVMGFSPYASVLFDPYPQLTLPHTELVMGMHNRFEVDLETENICNYSSNPSHTKVPVKYMKSLDLLNYNLRVLLHRNDTMGMAASIESRFPFLDSTLVKFGVNTPYDCKIRFSPTALDKRHYFFQDKWVIRQIASRYLPKELSHRKKLGFPVDAFNRLKVIPEYFEQSFIRDVFGFSKEEVNFLTANANQEFMVKLLQLDWWAHVCLFNRRKDTLSSKINSHIKINPCRSA